MKLIERAMSALGYERRADTYDQYWANFEALRTGTVSPATAEGISAVYACVSAISETIGSLPLAVYRKTDTGREKAPDHALYRVLHDQPNERQSALEFREQMTAHMLLRGNAYARIVRGGDGQVRQLIPLHPDRVRVLELENGRIGFEVTDSAGKVQRLTMDEMFHLRHRADDGVVGVSPIARAKGVLELADAEARHGVQTFENGSRLLGVLQSPGRLNSAQRQAVAEAWRAHKAGGTAVLDDGMSFSPLSMTLEDAEWIEARKFSVIEVARLFRVPPVIIQSMESANYSNSVELARQFVTLCLRRHLVAWEQAIHRQLLTEAGRRTYFVEHGVEGLLRGDSTTRASFYQSAIQNGWMEVNEVRRLENLPPLERKYQPMQAPKGAA
ncbi:phage portal protein [Thauera sp. WB-2]|uniref:phage portal protein n=1 Tax=Thauera sp. WB-2 TaxID=2897772 RepID=UPI0022DD4713|nr:phage portal protein [Thauera sp. WB-2]WBL65459.1 phage portal protein [Thauera sp. WB-2]